MILECKTWGEMWEDGAPIPRLLEGSENWFFVPKCGHPGFLLHEVTRNEDNTITVSPSIQCAYPGCTTHGYIENSQWRDA